MMQYSDKVCQSLRQARIFRWGARMLPWCVASVDWEEEESPYFCLGDGACGTLEGGREKRGEEGGRIMRWNGYKRN